MLTDVLLSLYNPFENYVKQSFVNWFSARLLDVILNRRSTYLQQNSQQAKILLLYNWLLL